MLRGRGEHWLDPMYTDHPMYTDQSTNVALPPSRIPALIFSVRQALSILYEPPLESVDARSGS